MKNESKNNEYVSNLFVLKKQKENMRVRDEYNFVKN